jgi:hypothetical protein
MALPTAAETISRYLFNSPTTPGDLKNNDLIRPEAAIGGAVQVDMVEYMSTGAGRFANAALSTLAQSFFEGSASALEGDGTRRTFSVQQMESLIGGDRSFALSQYNFHDEIQDDAERVFMFNTTGFKISDNAIFVVDELGNRSIENFAIYSYHEDFDFESSNIPTQFVNYFAAPWVDPSGIGRIFSFEMYNKESIATTTYDVNDYGSDLLRLSDEQSVSHWASLGLELHALFTGFSTSGITRFLDIPEYPEDPARPVFFGTTGNDTIGPADVAATILVDNMDNGIVLIGGDGDDQIFGADTDDVLYGGGDNDYLVGGGGYDIHHDGGGADILEGGAGGDDFILAEDGVQDIVIVEGDDWISRGDANDRIVMRTELIGLSPTDTSSHPAPMLSDGVSAIPLLGGFIYESDPYVYEAYYYFSGEDIVITPGAPSGSPELPPEPDEYSVGFSGAPPWGELISKNVDPGDGHVSYNSPFLIHYQYQLETPWGASALLIEVTRWTGGDQYTDRIFVYEFEEGDFGIQFENLSSLVVPEESGGHTLKYHGGTFVNYINNGGAYFSVPERSTQELENRLSAELVDVPSGSNGSRVELTPEGESGLLSFLGADIRGNFRDLAQFADSVNEAWPDNGPMFQAAESPSNELGYRDMPILSLLDGSPTEGGFGLTEYWFEPEPIGGLV